MDREKILQILYDTHLFTWVETEKIADKIIAEEEHQATLEIAVNPPKQKIEPLDWGNGACKAIPSMLNVAEKLDELIALVNKLVG